MDILLYKPQIPQNTGNIVRTCSVTSTGLILTRPLGFSVSSKHLKRAGLDYWNEVNIQYIDDLLAYLKATQRPFYFFSSKVTAPYTSINFSQDAILIFGSETFGLPPEIFDMWPEKCYTIPMVSDARCLNLSNSAAIVLYEALRQQDFKFANTN